MTIQELKARRSDLETKRNALVDQLADTDVQSMTLSGGGGSKSLTNRSVSQLKDKIAFIDREIARIDSQLGRRSNPNSIQLVEATFS